MATTLDKKSREEAIKLLRDLVGPRGMDRRTALSAVEKKVGKVGFHNLGWIVRDSGVVRDGEMYYPRGMKPNKTESRPADNVNGTGKVLDLSGDLEVSVHNAGIPLRKKRVTRVVLYLACLAALAVSFLVGWRPF